MVGRSINDLREAFFGDTDEELTALTAAADAGINFSDLVALFTGGGVVVLAEQSAPAAPAANLAKFYAQDNGSGKTQIVARFPTGAVQVIATEP